jgi:hypothetical protein
MKLQSARDLKLEVLETMVRPFVEASMASVLSGKSKAKAAALEFKPLSVSAGSTEARPHRSIALGLAQRGGEYKLAIRVQRQAMLHSPMVERLVAKAKGEVDLRLIGRVDKRPAKRKAKALAAQPWNRDDVRPMIIGSSIGHHAVTAGTIGAFVRVKGKDAIYVLSNNHVLANENNAKKGDVVLQRARADGGRLGEQDMAMLEQWVPLDPAVHNTMDAAIAELQVGTADPTLLRGILNDTDQLLRGAAAPDMTAAHKVGRTTGVTHGRITAIEVDNIVVGYEIGDVAFDDCIEIESSGNSPFSEGGDSGSLIVNPEMEGVGLLFAGTDTGGSNGLGVTYANPLLTVLKGLKAELLT